MNEERDTMVLEFDDGTSAELEILGVFEVNGKDYMALGSMADDGDDTEVYFYRYVELNDEEFELEDVSDEEFEMVEKEFIEIIAQE